MKVLAFSCYYTPEIAASMYLTEDIYKGIVDAGYTLEMYAPMPCRGINDEIRAEYKTKKKEAKYDGNFIIHRFSLYKEGRKVFFRALRYLILTIEFIWFGLWKKADVIFVQSTPPTQGFMAAFLKKFKRIPVVYTLQDIFPDSLVNAGICTENSLAFRIGRWMEKITYRNADKIIVISEDFKKNIMAKGVPEDKIVVVYNWVDGDSVHYVRRDENKLFDEYNLDRNKFYISYCGNIGLTQNIELLVDAAEELKQNTSIGFLLVGDGVYTEKLKKEIITRNLSNITLIPFQPYERIAEVFSIGDVGLIISKSGVGTNSVPSKTWSYMAAERPIIASFDVNSELADILRINHCGLIVEPDSKDELVNAIVKIYKQPESDYGKNGRKFVENNLTRKVGTEKYVDCITQVGRS